MRKYYLNKNYLKMLDEFYDAPTREIHEKIKKELLEKYNTGKRCFRCNSPLLPSDLKDYTYLCLECDENMYEFESI